MATRHFKVEIKTAQYNKFIHSFMHGATYIFESIKLHVMHMQLQSNTETFIGNNILTTLDQTSVFHIDVPVIWLH